MYSNNCLRLRHLILSTCIRPMNARHKLKEIIKAVAGQRKQRSLPWRQFEQAIKLLHSMRTTYRASMDNLAHAQWVCIRPLLFPQLEGPELGTRIVDLDKLRYTPLSPLNITFCLSSYSNSLVMCTSIILPTHHHLCSVPWVSVCLQPSVHQLCGLFLDQPISLMASKHRRRAREFQKSSSIHNSRASKQH